MVNKKLMYRIAMSFSVQRLATDGLYGSPLPSQNKIGMAVFPTNEREMNDVCQYGTKSDYRTHHSRVDHDEDLYLLWSQALF